MLAVYRCLAEEHDFRLLALAAFICMAASFAAITLSHHVRSTSGALRRLWLIVAAIATGFGIWATHFIAMLAFSPGLPTAYNVGISVLSLIGAIVLTGAGLSVALLTSVPHAAAYGGMIVGGGIAIMHYTGMAAFQIEGRLAWNPVLVAVSICLGELFGAISLEIGLRRNSMPSRILGALLLTLAICSHHFTAMGAVSIVPDPSVSISPLALPARGLAVGVALASIFIILLSLTALTLDRRDRRRSELEVERLRGLANAAVEGLVVICADEKIVAANNSFSQMTGRPTEAIIGERFESFLAHVPSQQGAFAQLNKATEAELKGAHGELVPVELISRSIDFAGKPHWAIAVRDLTTRKQAQQHILFLARHDSLTGLANRLSFYERLDEEIGAALSLQQKVAVLCLDLDHLKEVNDLFGHSSGDLMLQTFARVVTSTLAGDQIMARLGGDEFAIIMPQASPADVKRLVQSIFAALDAVRETTVAAMSISTSIGVAMCPDDATDAKSLLACADTALHRVKSEARGSCRLFEAAMGEQAHFRVMLEHDLRHAISRDELYLVYQPQKSIATGEIVGFEALLRWTHPLRGPISPAEFIPIAEESGAILQIGDFVLRRACREAARWNRPLAIAVNVSAVQLHETAFFDRVHEVLLETGLPPQRLELEITETAFIRDPTRVVATLRRLKALGTHIAMDDFGTGYSSISSLCSFPFNKIKIDRSFIKEVHKNEKGAVILRAMLGLGRGLEVPMLAEGVESADELRFLAEEGCEEIQGYLVSMPAPIEKFREFTDVSPNEQPQTATPPSGVATAA